TALSVSESRNQVFRVPLVDATSQKINTGKYSWSIDKNDSTVVFLKNVTDESQEYTIYFRFPGGSYVPGLKTIAANETVAFDLRQLRDQQIPDQDGNKIPLVTKEGSLSWSARSTKNLVSGQMEGPDNFVMIGRSEEIDTANGLSSTATYGCTCQDSYIDSWIEKQLPN